MAARLSAFGSPTMTTPAILKRRARSASSVSSVWLMVPSVVRAATTTGSPSRSHQVNHELGLVDRNQHAAGAFDDPCASSSSSP